MAFLLPGIIHKRLMKHLLCQSFFFSIDYTLPSTAAYWDYT